MTPVPNPTDTARALVLKAVNDARSLGILEERESTSNRYIREATERAETSRAALLAHVVGVRTCQWSFMDWPESESDYETACGKAWSLTDGDLAKNGVNYCPFCGGKVIAPEPTTSCRDCGDTIPEPDTLCADCFKADALATRPTEARDS